MGIYIQVEVLEESRWGFPLMKKKTSEKNPYERIFDDANRRIKEKGISLDHLDEIPKIKRDSVRIPFPYGEENNRDIEK